MHFLRNALYFPVKHLNSGHSSLKNKQTDGLNEIMVLTLLTTTVRVWEEGLSSGGGGLRWGGALRSSHHKITGTDRAKVSVLRPDVARPGDGFKVGF